MPIYSYVCTNCGNTFEEMRYIKDRDVPIGEECVACGRDTVARECGNNGGFRLSKEGSVGWSEDGYATTHGDAENFKAGRKVYD